MCVTYINNNSVESTYDSVFAIDGNDLILKQSTNVKSPQICNKEITLLTELNKNNCELKYIIEKDNNIYLESEFINDNKYGFLPKDVGIYKLKVQLRKNGGQDILLESHINYYIKSIYRSWARRKRNRG